MLSAFERDSDPLGIGNILLIIIIIVRRGVLAQRTAETGLKTRNPFAVWPYAYSLTHLAV